MTGYGYTWREWAAVTNAGTLPVPVSPISTGLTGASTWNSSNGIGQIYSSSDMVDLRGFLRGGSWYYGGADGVLSLFFNANPSNSHDTFGFRVATSSGL